MQDSTDKAEIRPNVIDEFVNDLSAVANKFTWVLVAPGPEFKSFTQFQSNWMRLRVKDDANNLYLCPITAVLQCKHGIKCGVADIYCEGHKLGLNITEISMMSDAADYATPNRNEAPRAAELRKRFLELLKPKETIVC